MANPAAAALSSATTRRRHAGDFHSNTPGFSDLSKAEKVRYLQSLWDQISEHPDEIPVPESHLLLAEERLRRYRENPSAVSAFDVMVQRGLKDSDEGRTTPNEEMHRRIKTWQK